LCGRRALIGTAAPVTSRHRRAEWLEPTRRELTPYRTPTNPSAAVRSLAES